MSARDVLEGALPTEAMLRLGSLHVPDDDPQYPAIDVWRAMFDAASPLPDPEKQT